MKSSVYVCAKHKRVRKLPEHMHQLGTLLQEEEGWANTRVPDQGIGSTWDWQEDSVAAPVWDRNQSDNRGFFPLIVQ